MRHSLDDVFYGIEALKTRYDPVEEECFDDPSTPKEPVDYEALDKGTEALQFEAEAIQTKADLILTCMEEMSAYQSYIKNYGADRAVLSLLNRNNRFSNYLNVTLPSCESMSNIGSPYSELSLICMEGIGKTLKKFGKTLWKTIKAVFKWITTPFRALWKKIKEAWKEVDTKKKSHLGNKEDIKKVVKALRESSQQIIKRYGKKKFDEDIFDREIKDTLKEAFGEKMYYVENEQINDGLSQNLANAANAIATGIATINSTMQNIDNTTNNPLKTNAIQTLVKSDSIWNNEKTKIIESNPDESSKPLLHIVVDQTALKSTTETLDKFLKGADEIYKKIETKIAKDNTSGTGSGSGTGGNTGGNTGGGTDNNTGGGTDNNTNSDADSFKGDTLKDFLAASKAIQKVASFIINALGHSAHNCAISEKYSQKIEKSLLSILSEFEVPNEDRDTAMQNLNVEYHKRISFYFGSGAAAVQK